MKYYSAINRNKLLIQAITWMSLQRIMLSVRKPIVEGYCCMTSLLKWQNYRNELKTEWPKEASGWGYSRTIWKILALTEVFCILTASMSISWLWYCSTVLQDITTTGGVKDTQFLSVLFLTTTYSSTIFFKFNWKKSIRSIQKVKSITFSKSRQNINAKW